MIVVKTVHGLYEFTDATDVDTLSDQNSQQLHVIKRGPGEVGERLASFNGWLAWCKSDGLSKDDGLSRRRLREGAAEGA